MVGYSRNDPNNTFLYSGVIAVRDLTIKGPAFFTKSHPFFLQNWIKYTYYYRETNPDGTTTLLPNMTRDEYHPNINDESDANEILTYTTPTAFDTPYIWKIQRTRCTSIMSNISITCDYTQEQYKYDSCARNIPWYIGDFPLKPSILTCEDYITQLCQVNPNDRACTCLREEEELDPSLPVICFGQHCLDQGFVFRRMKDQDCNVNICQQLINVNGDNNMQITGSHHITCGHQVYSSEEMKTINNWTPTTQNKTIDPYVTIDKPKEDGLCNWHVILLFCIGFLLIMWIPIIVVYVRKQEQIRLMNLP
jgi:hypothetical protein